MPYSDSTRFPSGVFQSVCVDLFQDAVPGVSARDAVQRLYPFSIRCISECVDLFQDAVPGVSVRDAIQRLYPFSIRCISECVLICFRMLCLVCLREMPYSDSTRFPSCWARKAGLLWRTLYRFVLLVCY